ncbi:uncharacterized protein LOC120669353 [Panicum virgatum]|uniref:uncharacterized protein LOC120669353 n=1 Tax=Panicum virgatum TaxID=38727 RepID=UPI0019D641C1|nr:uncharacterized protein LOC120669353 [Panicum virgatum]
MVVVTRAKRRILDDESRRLQEMPPGGSEGSGPDLVSGLPDALLGEIITRLPTAFAVHTLILSSRSLWRTAPLNLEAKLDAEEEAGKDLVPVLDALLRDHQGPLRRFSLRWLRPFDRFRIVDSMLQSHQLGELQEFEMFASHYDNSDRWSLIPNSVPHFSPTLRVLNISCNTGMLEFPK